MVKMGGVTNSLHILQIEKHNFIRLRNKNLTKHFFIWHNYKIYPFILPINNMNILI